MVGACDMVSSEIALNGQGVMWLASCTAGRSGQTAQPASERCFWIEMATEACRCDGKYLPHSLAALSPRAGEWSPPPLSSSYAPQA